MKKGTLRFKREYPKKCKNCPKILNSDRQEDLHIKRNHLK